MYILCIYIYIHDIQYIYMCVTSVLVQHVITVEGQEPVTQFGKPNDSHLISPGHHGRRLRRRRGNTRDVAC